MKKKALTLVMSFVFFTCLMNLNAFAQVDELSNFNIDYENGLGHEGRTLEEIIEELVSGGSSFEEAEFYAKMDILAAELTRNDIELDLNNVLPYNQTFAIANKNEIRDRALQLDKSALKTLMLQNAALKHGASDLEKMKDMYMALGEEKSKYVIKYSDGTEYSFHSYDIAEEESSTEVRTEDTLLSGPWDESHAHYGDNFISGNQSWTSTRYMEYKMGVSIARVKDILKWSYTVGNSSVDFISDNGAASYAGVVQIDKEYLSNHQTGKSSGFDVLQGYTDVRFVVTGSFSATWGFLQISVNGGTGWHQYVISEIIVLSPDHGAIGAYGYGGQFM